MKEQTKCYCGHTTYCDCGPEEPKRECMITKFMQMDAKIAYDSLPKQNKIMERFIANAKQETLEEAAEKFTPKSDKWIIKKIFIEGAEWQQDNSNINALNFEIDALKKQIELLKYQQERSYSEEDLKDAFFEGWIARDCKLTFSKAKNKWFKELKNTI